MDNTLRDIIKKIRKVFKEDPDSTVIGKLTEGITNEEIRKNDNVITYNDTLFKEYYEFLNTSEESAFGAIVFFGYNELSKYQFYVEDIPRGFSQWVCIGKIMSDPIMLSKRNGEVYCFSGHPFEVIEKGFGNFDYFLFNYVFGEKYSEIIPGTDEDGWYQLLIRQGIV